MGLRIRASDGDGDAPRSRSHLQDRPRLLGGFEDQIEAAGQSFRPERSIDEAVEHSRRCSIVVGIEYPGFVLEVGSNPAAIFVHRIR